MTPSRTSAVQLRPVPPVFTGVQPSPLPPNCTWEQARRIALECARPLPPTQVPLRHAVGRTLAWDLTALHDMPHYASSAMDGWVTRGPGPWILAGPGGPLGRDQAAPIITGGLIPPGAQAVLRMESGVLTSRHGGGLILERRAEARPDEPRIGQHIRKAGEEAAFGEVLIRRGTVLNPAHVALAALAGHDALPVLGKPVVQLLMTGSEVVASGLPAPGWVRDAFGPQLGSVVDLSGAFYGGQAMIGDDYCDWIRALKGPGAVQGLRPDPADAPVDVTITTGGTGPSGNDHLRRAVAELGGRLLVDGIAMRPGHPTVLAALPDGRFILGLPGNPLAAMMALFTIGAPLLAALGHKGAPRLHEVSSACAIAGDQARTRLIPFRFAGGEACPAENTGPGMMRGLASADGIMVLPPGGVQRGAAVKALSLPWREPLSSRSAPDQSQADHHLPGNPGCP